jgi:hypothetical protein
MELIKKETRIPFVDSCTIAAHMIEKDRGKRTIFYNIKVIYLLKS